MGQEQTSAIEKRGKKEINQSDIDVISQIYEEGPKTAKQRMIEAVRISEVDRTLQQHFKEQQKIQQKGTQMLSETDIIPSEILRDTTNQMLILTTKNCIQNMTIQYLKKGTMTKQSPALFGSDQLRYCTLTSNRFVYHNDKSQISQEAGILNFDLLSCHARYNSHALVITIDGCDKQFIFRSPKGDDDTKDWVDKIKKITQESFGRRFKLTSLSKYHRFWRKDYFSQKQFRETAQTGDLILMRGKKNSAAIQRALTQEQFDHIAVVLKNSRNDILLFQANGGVGVGIMPWHKFISKKFYKKQQLVVYRKLNIERNEEFMNQISDFVQRNMGRKYKFSVKKYFLNRESQEGQDNKSYFCSSLVAKLYKNLQILDDLKSSTQYLPASFSEKQKIGFKQNGKHGPVNLGRQKIVVFQQLFFQQN